MKTVLVSFSEPLRGRASGLANQAGMLPQDPEFAIAAHILDRTRFLGHDSDQTAATKTERKGAWHRAPAPRMSGARTKVL